MPASVLFPRTLPACTRSSSLRQASRDGDLAMVQNLLKSGVNVTHPTNQTHPLLVAKTVEIARALLDHGADTECQDSQNATPIHFAAQEDGGGVDVVQLLLDKGANVNAANDVGVTALHKAVYSCDDQSTEIVRRLLEHGADTNAADNRGCTALHWAAEHCSVEKVRRLLDHGANVNSATIGGETPMHCVARSKGDGHTEILELFLERGATVNVCNLDGETPLRYAVLCGYEGEESCRRKRDMVRRLLDHGAHVNGVDNRSMTPLHHFLFVERFEVAGAILEAVLYIVGLFLDRGAKVNVSNELGETPLHRAARLDSAEPARLLLDRGAIVDAEDGKGQTPLNVACSMRNNPGCAAMVRLLMERGANADAVDGYGTRPLEMAVRFKHLEAARVLLELGADINAPNINGETVLHTEAYMGHDTDFYKVLLDHGGDVNAVNTKGKTPLHRAAGSSPEVVRLLLDYGADIEATDKNGKTPLHCAARDGRECSVRLLVEKGANIGAVDAAGNTPLFHGACGRYTFRCARDIVRWLLERGAGFYLCGGDSRSAWKQKRSMTQVGKDCAKKQRRQIK